MFTSAPWALYDIGLQWRQGCNLQEPNFWKLLFDFCQLLSDLRKWQFNIFNFGQLTKVTFQPFATYNQLTQVTLLNFWVCPEVTSLPTAGIFSTWMNFLSTCKSWTWFTFKLFVTLGHFTKVTFVNTSLLVANLFGGWDSLAARPSSRTRQPRNITQRSQWPRNFTTTQH